MNDLLLAGYDAWLDRPFERDMDARAEAAESEDDDERALIPCSRCGKPTTFDPTYGDLCFRCIRAENE